MNMNIKNLKMKNILNTSMRVMLAVALFLLAACGPKWTETPTENGYNLISQSGGPTLGYAPESGVKILTDKGFAFKDLNRNGVLDVYEDWRKTAEERAQDLAEQLSIEEIAGLMLYSAHQSIPDGGGYGRGGTYDGKPFAESGAQAYDLSDNQKKFLKDDNLRAVLVTSVESPEVAAKWNNKVQAFVEGLNHGIPANNSSDPRNATRADAEFNAGSGGKISLWPSSLGLAATFDPDLVKRFGLIAAREYRALGIATALSPQIDLATEPRWSRFNGTFGEDPDLATDLARAYVDGFQTSTGADEIADGWGYASVNAMIKHWPSGGPEEGGRDGHFNYGKYAVYPGDNLQTQMQTFVDGAFKLDGPTGMASAVMPYYTISYGQDPSGKNVGNSYSRYIITDLLRDKYGFDGVVCTDWNITKDNAAIEAFDGKCWGVETLTEAERHYEVIKAGVDQFGGNNDKGPVLEAYRMYVRDFGEEAAKERFAKSAERLLLQSFRTGLFENAYLDPAKSAEIVGNSAYMQSGFEAQLKSVVLLKNHQAALPKSGKLKVYVPKRHYPSSAGMFGMGALSAERWNYPVSKELVEKYYEWVETPAEADFALVLIQSPSAGSGYDVADRRKGGNGYVPISLQYNDYSATYARETSLAGGDPKENFTNRSYKDKTVKTGNINDMRLVVSTRKEMGAKPVIVVVATSNPFVPAEIEPYADAILLAMGVQNQAVLDLVSGKAEPSGLLPMQMPADMRTVEEQFEDVPRDMKCYRDADGNTYDFAFGLNWKGVIQDERVTKYGDRGETE